MSIRDFFKKNLNFKNQKPKLLNGSVLYLFDNVNVCSKIVKSVLKLTELLEFLKHKTCVVLNA